MRLAYLWGASGLACKGLSSRGGKAYLHCRLGSWSEWKGKPTELEHLFSASSLWVPCDQLPHTPVVIRMEFFLNCEPFLPYVSLVRYFGAAMKEVTDINSINSSFFLVISETWRTPRSTSALISGVDSVYPQNMVAMVLWLCGPPTLNL